MNPGTAPGLGTEAEREKVPLPLGAASAPTFHEWDAAYVAFFVGALLTMAVLL